MKLSKKQIIRFCDETIADINNGCQFFLCHALKDYIKNKTFWVKLFGVNKDLSKHIPEFTYENASKYCNAKFRFNSNVPSYDRTWWSIVDSGYQYNYKDRIKFLEWIKTQYTTPKK